MAGHNTRQMGNQHSTIAPYGEMLTTRDNKYTVLAVGTDKQFQKLCEVLHKPGLSTDPRFNTNQRRVVNRLAMMEMLQPEAAKMTREELLHQLNVQKVPAGPVRDIKEVFDDAECMKRWCWTKR